MSEAAVAIPEQSKPPVPPMPPAEVAIAPAPKRPSAPLQLRRHFDAKRLNSIVNHPSIRPWVADEAEGTLDLSAAVENRENVLLMSEHGGCLFYRLMPGILEVHSQVLPEGRGPWALALAKAVLHWVFTRTDAFEVITYVPHGNIAAKALSLAVGMRFEFTRDNVCRLNGKLGPAGLYAIRIQDWALRAKGFERIGEKFLMKLQAESPDTPHVNDPNQNHYLGIALEMLSHGQPAKAVNWYSRWAHMARHSPVDLLAGAENPEVTQCQS